MALVLDGSNDTITGLQINSANIVNGSIVNDDINASAAIASSKISGSLGKILQVQQTVGTGTYSTSSLTYSDTVTCAITPSATTSKIICIYKIGLSANNGGYSASARLVRDSTAIYVGAAAGNRDQASSNHTADNDTIGHVSIEDQSGTFMDSPNTTSAITYRLQFRSNYSGYTVYAGRPVENADATYRARVPTSLLLMEVGA